MARTAIVTATADAATEEFTVSGEFYLFADGFEYHDGMAFVQRRNNADTGYVDATNDNGPMCVGYAPNTAYFYLPAGTYQLAKQKTANPTSVYFEEA